MRDADRAQLSFRVRLPIDAELGVDVAFGRDPALLALAPAIQKRRVATLKSAHDQVGRAARSGGLGTNRDTKLATIARPGRFVPG